MLSQEIHNIAAETRLWAENRKFAYAKDLEGLCGIASVELFRRLKAANFTPKLHVSEHHESAHVFVVIDQHIVDITATQFDHIEKVATRYIPKEFEFSIFRWYWRSKKIFSSAEELIKYQQETGWYKHQIAQ